MISQGVLGNLNVDLDHPPKMCAGLHDPLETLNRAKRLQRPSAQRERGASAAKPPVPLAPFAGQSPPPRVALFEGAPDIAWDTVRLPIVGYCL